jgi:hypothetical protein
MGGKTLGELAEERLWASVLGETGVRDQGSGVSQAIAEN